jgi:hypothetical protein
VAGNISGLISWSKDILDSSVSKNNTHNDILSEKFLMVESNSLKSTSNENNLSPVKSDLHHSIERESKILATSDTCTPVKQGTIDRLSKTPNSAQRMPNPNSMSRRENRVMLECKVRQQRLNTESEENTREEDNKFGFKTLSSEYLNKLHPTVVSKVNKSFSDLENNVIYKIIGVCYSSQYQTYFYKYYDTSKYSGCPLLGNKICVYIFYYFHL